MPWWLSYLVVQYTKISPKKIKLDSAFVYLYGIHRELSSPIVGTNGSDTNLMYNRDWENNSTNARLSTRFARERIIIVYTQQITNKLTNYLTK